ncbi:VOC family protein [Actinoallomurus sp. CA-150999]|uniref:VOC family protein n=1 Tax=Actinoallomurus sp. CA-150999 TaxID=3239887 RepID=UPI003D91F53B
MSETENLAVVGLSYVAVQTSRLDEWLRFGTELLGLAPSSLKVPNGFALRADERIARFLIQDGDSPEGIAAIGWEVASRREWDALLSRLDAASVPVEIVTGEAAAERGVTAYASATDPSGYAVEFCYAPVIEPITHFVSPIGARFITGEQGLGHVTQVVANYEESVDFYTRILGFHVRESIDLAIRATFAGCNSRQHSIALIDGNGVNADHHVMLEVDSIDDVGRALDKVNDGAAKLTVGLGRHWNDKMISFYMETPSGFQIEYGFGGLQVDPKRWTEVRQGGRGGASMWGHVPVKSLQSAQGMEGFGAASKT